jgi:hypothetical protein
MKKQFFIGVAILMITISAKAQYNITEVTGLGKLSALHMAYYPNEKAWTFSNGFYVFKTWNDFNDAKLLFNTYPKFQFSLDRFPNKNYFSRHFDTKGAPYGFEYRTKLLDSSAIYIMGDSLKSINQLSPYTIVKIVQPTAERKVITWAANNCFVWGKDSSVICNNGTIGIERKINGKDSLQRIFTPHCLTALQVSADAEYAAAGTRDSGFYFIPTASPRDYVRLPISSIDNAVIAFYFDDKKQQLWVEEGERWVKGFTALSQYDYSSGIPKLIKTYTAEDFGIENYDETKLAFDFVQDKLYIQSVLSKLILFDFKIGTVVHDFFGLIHSYNITKIHQLYFNTFDSTLYFSASKFDSTFSNGQNFLYRIQPRNDVYVQQVIPKNKQADYQLYPVGLTTVVNQMPTSSWKQKVSISNNDLALFSYSDNTYLLYNIRNGNMITAFPSANVDLNTFSRISKDNTASLSPNGKYIFEWMIKAGITSGIADTLQMALINVATGVITKKHILLAGGNKNEAIQSFAWDNMDRPQFVKKSNGQYPVKQLETFYLDSLLLAHTTNTYNVVSNEVLYDAWQIPGSNDYLIRTGKLNNERIESISIVGGNNEVPRLLLSAASINTPMINDLGIYLSEKSGDSVKWHWYNLKGEAIYAAHLSNNVDIQQLSQSQPLLYVREKRTYQPSQINLTNGKLNQLYSATKPGFSYTVSPNDQLLVSVSDDIQTWQLQKDTLYKLYHLKAEKDFIRYTQITNKYLVSDGRIWNLSNGLLIQADLVNTAVLNDSMQLSSISPNDLLEDGGWGLSEEKRYTLKSIKQLFVPSAERNKNLYQWQRNFNRILVAAKNLTATIPDAVYELPFTRDYGLDLKLYPLSGQQSVMVLKKGEFKTFDNDLLTSNTDSVVVLNMQTGKLSNILAGKIVGQKQLHNNVFIFYLLNQKTKIIQPYSIENNQLKKINHTVKLSVDNFQSVNIVDANTILSSEAGALIFHNLQTDKKTAIIRFRYLSSNYFNFGDVFYDDVEKAIFIAYDDGGIVKIKDGKIEACVKAVASVESIAGSQGNYLLLLDKLGNYYMVNKQTLVADLTLFTWKGGGYADRKYLWLTKENYYMATPGVESNIHFVQNSTVIPLKQGDLQYNRPDKVLEYLNAPQTDIDFYKQLHQIRLNKYKASTTGVGGVASTVQLQTQASLSPKQLSLTVNANAENAISAVQVVVNGCPIVVAPTTNTKQLQQTIQVPLNAGENVIYTWVEDAKGNRSSFDERKIVGEFADSGKWYFVGIGVSKYKDSAQNLKYADKDIRDISLFLSKEYPGIIIDTLLNDQVTAAAIQQLSNRLQQTKPDDKIMLSFSGHGLLDENKKFWYATHDVDFSAPERNGFSMAAITGIFHQVPARYRMITLDACHSGDVVAGFTTTATPVVFQQPVEKQSGIKGSKLLGKGSGQSSATLLKSMQMIFTDQLSNTGINLIAASSGTEFALEGEQWNNGVFTYALLNGWRWGAKVDGRYNSSKKVHYRDLKQYLQQTVSAITNGRQTPNTVMENGEINWWLVPER